MGYSYAQVAGFALEELIKMLQANSVHQHNPSNTWDIQGEVTYFYETGQEQPDGAITGSVEKFVGEHRCRRAGNFRIEPTGWITRFPTTTAEQRKQAFHNARDRHVRNQPTFSTQ